MTDHSCMYWLCHRASNGWQQNAMLPTGLCGNDGQIARLHHAPTQPVLCYCVGLVLAFCVIHALFQPYRAAPPASGACPSPTLLPAPLFLLVVTRSFRLSLFCYCYGACAPFALHVVCQQRSKFCFAVHGLGARSTGQLC